MTCYDRVEESESLWKLFKKRKNVLMLAPRRIGKTVLLNHLKDESESKGYHAIVLDVQGIREEKTFFQRMCGVIQSELGMGTTVITSFTDKLRQTIKGMENTSADWRQLLLHTEWNEFADHLLSHLNQDQKPWLILLDEIPIFALALLESHGIERVHDFLYTLRQYRHRYPNVRWVFTGSIGLDSIARRNNIEGALNDFEAYPLNPFSEKTACEFIKYIALSETRNIADGVAQHITKRLGWLAPYYLEKITFEATQLVKANEEISLQNANQAFEALLKVEKRMYWSTWREHLENNFADPEKTHLFLILNTIAESPDGHVSKDTLLNVLQKSPNVDASTLRDYLHTLEADGYLLPLENDANRYQFRMGLLREWWQRYIVSK